MSTKSCLGKVKCKNQSDKDQNLLIILLINIGRKLTNVMNWIKLGIWTTGSKLSALKGGGFDPRWGFEYVVLKSHILKNDSQPTLSLFLVVL